MEKYVVFGTTEQWNYYMWKAYIDSNEAIWMDLQNLFSNKVKTKICRSHFRKSMQIGNLPFKCFWYKPLCKKIGISNSNKKYYFFFYDWNPFSADLKFIKYLKRRFPNSHFCYMFTNIISKSCAYKYKYVDKLANCYDFVIAFDSNDAHAYGFFYHPLIFNLNNQFYKSMPTRYDFCYCGNAKTENRLIQIHEAYSKAFCCGFSCFFNIVGVQKEKQIDGIRYNEKIEFNQYINIILQSRVIVDITQDNSTGIPLNIVLAILFNKKIYTNNKEVLNLEGFPRLNVAFINHNVNLIEFMSQKVEKYPIELKNMFSLEHLLKTLKKNC